ncbi:transglutaminase family protein [Flavitalea sp. BT771]|jgi:regulator of sirC expression with transglutaminase-like and TPR domain|uniref:transglutaminase family protein n=1 Tax=Flavitalea sp. BT771 TaxID=3063329 RepID=UPI0026E296D8|nr:transglutaminase family protein [Flavitalea sp. BT771]MDO6434588.1 transglutaminase family protein [Flavitalea sp. BT771]MDV6223488.1 transglutaminase family protein [Flavitalea sp. BT771]
MQENKEIKALFHLIDDPDQEVFDSVSSRIVSYGRGIIPNLENLWENTISGEVQERIELLIHKLHYHDLTEDFIHWKNSSYQDLLTAALLVSKFQYPDLVTTPVLQEVEKLRRNIWLELNSYLTPLEQVNVLTSILYNYYGLKGTEVAYQQPEEFLINKLIETKRGNSIANGILYLLLSELLDIPVKAINIPRQFVLAYIKPTYDENPERLSAQQRIEFFIDPMSGQVFSHKDVDSYFKRVSVPPVASYFKPLSHNRIIQTTLEEFSKCFEDERNAYKQKELLELAKLLNE